MSTIIAGLFDTRAMADEAVGRLHRAGVSDFEISVFVVDSPGQRDDWPKRAQEYVRAAGTMVAVNASASEVAAETIASILKESGAVEVERAAGEWNGGTWSDFDALRPPQRIDIPPPIPSSRASASRAR